MARVPAAHLFAGLVLAAILAPASAAAQTSPQPFAPYDGSIPFVCELQDVGTGTDYPDPEADPFCVKFDKTNQNVTGFGIVEFLAQEPVRVGAAAPKCFYYQRDEWTGSIQQGQEPELWHWTGGYFFDKARGVGGVSVRDYRVGGTPQDASPFAPPQYQPYFDETGGGGFMFQEQGVEPDPRCVAMVDTPEERRRVYRDATVFPDCIPPGGELRGRRVGNVKLGMARQRVIARLGEPRAEKRGIDRWCVVGGDNLRIDYAGGREAVAVVRTSVHGHAERGIAPGSSLRRAVRRLDATRRFRDGRTRVYEGERKARRRLFFGARGRRVRWLALADPRRIRSAGIETALRRAG